MKTLNTLISLTQKKLDDLQKRIAMLEADMQRLADERVQMQRAQVQGFDHAAKRGSNEPQLFGAAEHYAQRSKERDEELAMTEDFLKAKMLEFKTELKGLFAEKKRLEVILENRQKAAKLKRERKQQAQLDDIAGQRKSQDG